MCKPLILVVEEDKSSLNQIVAALDMQGYRYHTAAARPQALRESASAEEAPS